MTVVERDAIDRRVRLQIFSAGFAAHALRHNISQLHLFRKGARAAADQGELARRLDSLLVQREMDHSRRNARKRRSVIAGRRTWRSCDDGADRGDAGTAPTQARTDASTATETRQRLPGN